MLKRLALWLFVGIFVSPSAFAKEQSHDFILLGADAASLEREVVLESGALSHDLKYHRGIVARLTPSAAKRIQEKLGSAVYMEEDHPAFIQGQLTGRPKPGPNPPPQSVPWGISAVHAVEAAALNRGAGVTVCVVDTGVQADHPDLAANIVGGENFVTAKRFVDPTKWADDNGHGTHVSGTIAALDNGFGVIGVAPNSRIFAAKVLNSAGSGTYSAIAEGIRSCMRNGAQVINMSLGGASDSLILHQAIIDASGAGIVLVAAAGNESGAVSYPAKYPEVLAVTAVDSSLAFAYFSNSGTEVDFTAPGVSVTSTTKGGAYAVYSGTSMAAPHVAGVVALAISSGSLGLVADSIGLSADQQGAGLINAFKTVSNR